MVDETFPALEVKVCAVPQRPLSVGTKLLWMIGACIAVVIGSLVAVQPNWDRWVEVIILAIIFFMVPTHDQG